jgi:hypothetical protein
MELLPVPAATSGAATANVEDAQGSGQNGCGASEFLEAAVKHPSDEGGVIRNAHGRLQETAY